MNPKISLAPEIMSSVERALSEDIGAGDATTDSIVPPAAVLEGRIIAKDSGVAAGVSIARVAFQLVDENLGLDRKSTRLNSSHSQISYAVFCLKKKKQRY